MDGVIALADAEAVAEGRFAPNVEAVRTQKLMTALITKLRFRKFEDQMACADIILLTKTDLASSEAILAAKSVIARKHPVPFLSRVAEGVLTRA